MCRLREMVQRQRQLPEAFENGVALTLTEFEMLSKMLPEINEDIPNLETIIPCQYTYNEETFSDHCKQSTPFET